jgi:oligopeptide transport system substrate-binding protein
MYRTLLGILAVFACALLVVGFTFSAASEEPADYTFINGTEPKSLDPALITGQPEGRLADALFEGLTRRNTATMRPEPGVASSWELSDDKRTWTFHFRPEARWSDGKPVTAHDFVWSWKRMLEPEMGAEYAYLLHGVRGAEAYNLYAGNARAILGASDAERAAARKMGKELDEPETIVAGAARLLKESPGGLPRAAWDAFLEKTGAREHLKGTHDRLLLAALSLEGETLPPEMLTALPAALESEGLRRRAAHREAVERFGVDLGILAKDDHTFVVQLIAPSPYFFEITGFYPLYPVPRWVARPRASGDIMKDEQQDWFLPAKLVGNGPFRMGYWRVNGKMRLSKSPSYWNQARVRMKHVDVYPVDNVTTALNLYLTGEADWLPGYYPLDLSPDLKKRPDYYAHPGSSTYFYRFNTSKKPFDDPRVRKAVCLAFDRKVVVEAITQRGEPPALRLVPPGMDGYEPPESAIRHDPEEARRLLAEAGYPGGRGFPQVSILFNTHEGHRKVAEYIADALKNALGIPVRAHNQEWQAYQESQRLLQYDMARAGWIADYQDPKTFLDMWLTKGGNNQTGWSNAVYDRLVGACANVEAYVDEELLDDLVPKLKEPDVARRLMATIRAGADVAARAEAGLKLRAHLFREAEAILFQDAFPVMPIYHYVNTGLVRPWVKEFYKELVLPDGTTATNLQDLHPFHDVWIDHDVKAREGVR